MLIAVASEGLDVSRHFGHCTNYNYYRVEDDRIIDSQNLPAGGTVDTRLAPLFAELGVKVLLTGGVSASVKQQFEDAGIVVVLDAQGRALKAAQSYLGENITAFESDDLD